MMFEINSYMKYLFYMFHCIIIIIIIVDLSLVNSNSKRGYSLLG